MMDSETDIDNLGTLNIKLVGKTIAFQDQRFLKISPYVTKNVCPYVPINRQAYVQ